MTATERGSRLNALLLLLAQVLLAQVLLAQAIDAEPDHVVGFQSFGSGVAPRQGAVTSLLQRQT
jgi:hypothetical protein